MAGGGQRYSTINAGGGGVSPPRPPPRGVAVVGLVRFVPVRLGRADSAVAGLGPTRPDSAQSELYVFEKDLNKSVVEESEYIFSRCLSCQIRNR